LAAVVALAGAGGVVRVMPRVRSHAGDLLVLAVGSIVWGVLCWAVLRVTGSTLPNQLRRRFA